MAGQQASYSIGQIIYILSNKSQSVVPAIVAEEDCRKILEPDGVQEVVSYKLCIGPKDRQKTVDMNRIDGEVFTSLEDIRVHLVQSLTTFVDDLVIATQNNTRNWYGVAANNQVLETSNSGEMGEKFDPEQIINSVNNNLPLPQSGRHPLQLAGGAQTPQQGPISPHLSMRDNIRVMVSPGEEDPMQGLGLNQNSSSQQYAILPDGTRVPIRQ